MNPTKLILGLLGPLITAASGLLAAAAGKYGVHLDPTGVADLGTAGAVAGATFVVKLIHDVETTVEKKDPALVARVEAVERKVAGLVGVAVKVDPQLEVAAHQAEAQVAAKVEQAGTAAAAAITNVASGWPTEPAPVVAAAPAAPVEQAPNVTIIPPAA